MDFEVHQELDQPKDTGAEDLTPDTVTSRIQHFDRPVYRRTSESNFSVENRLLETGHTGTPGLRLRGVALFMDDKAEKLGISFCIVNESKTVAISPGLAALINGSTFRNTMKRKIYNTLDKVIVASQHCRLLRVKNKTIALFEDGNVTTQFAQACSVLKSFGQSACGRTAASKVISVDAMAVGFLRGRVDDYIGCLEASQNHEVVVYENRGEDLSYLKPITSKSVNPISINVGAIDLIPSLELSGAERLQQKIALEKSAEMQKCSTSSKTNKKSNQSLIKSILPQAIPTKADMGLVEPPSLKKVKRPLDHIVNAFLEFLTFTRGTKVINQRICENILQSYRTGNNWLLNASLNEASAAIYNNQTSTLIRGQIVGNYMAAYSASCGFVALDDEETLRTGNLKFVIPNSDPIVVITECTRVLLEDKILDMATIISGPNKEDTEFWRVPKLVWINGVPGCGKTTWVVNKFKAESDLIITTTTEAAAEMKERLANLVGNQANIRVRTMASILVNGLPECEIRSFNRLLIDDALVNHFGAIVMAIRIACVSEAFLIDDINQLPFIDRNGLFKLRYSRPNLVTSISKELLCTHRNPMDVAYALSEVYRGIYSSSLKERSLELRKYSGAQIPKNLKNTLYLVHTQMEKERLKGEGYGKGEGSRTLTIQEAQGRTFETTVIVRADTKPQQLYSSITHGVVAVSRHKKRCIYYTDISDGDAIARFILRSKAASISTIRDYNLKMAIQDRNSEVISALTRENKETQEKRKL